MTAHVESPISFARPSGSSRRAIGYWLLTVAVLVVAMVLLGGATRLTNSGLSMVHWQFHGSLPPLDDAAWQQEFARYQQFPEYQKVNVGMTMAEFQKIYWFEYSHRMLGRLIGLAFAIPLLWFLLRRRIDARLLAKLIVLLVLGGTQGLVGWWMVKSGLVDHPDVSHYRLATHLGLAAILLMALLWVGLDQLRPAVANRRRPSVSLRVFGWCVCGLAFGQFLLGGLVAGLNAGLVYNSFPTMGGHWVPPEMAGIDTLAAMFDEPVAVQFLHRVGALIVTVATVAFWLRAKALVPAVARGADLMLLALLVQVGLGIATILAFVPLGLALAHQAGGLALLASIVALQHRLSGN